MFSVDWPELKAFVDDRKLSVQFVELEDKYLLVAFDSIFCLDSVIQKTPSEDLTEFESNYKSKGNKVPALTNSPFAAKILPNGKKIFTRMHGITAVVQNAPDTIDFVVPYTACKITGIEINGAKLGDTANFKVVDTAQGTYSGAPNFVLNQFGFDVNIAEKEYKYKSDYDADLYGGMKLRIEYDPVDELLPKTIYINFILHEIKD